MAAHKELVEIAYRWVLKNGSCGFAFKELHSLSSEIPDVIGFGADHSILIEVKVSRSDFIKDKDKPHRKSGGMGDFRLFCCPTGLIKPEELPDKWGLIYVNEKGRAMIQVDPRKVRDREKRYPFYYAHRFHDKCRVSEMRIMYTALRRMAIKGYLKHIYDKSYDRATANDIIESNS